MLFNSIDFAIFLPIVFTLYWLIPANKISTQNLLLVLASYVFYGWWDWRFLSLVLFSTTVDFLVGLGFMNQRNPTKRRVLLWTSILVNIGFLGFFKYYNFFVDNFITAFSFFGHAIKPNSLNIILPVGISFYTFQTLGYALDVYKQKLEPTKDFVAFAAFVSFFPQLVAGPIERATNLLPQFYHKRVFEYSKAIDGMRQILWGLFKKIVIADNAADFANLIFNNSNRYPGSVLLLGAIFFAIQIYCDFSGYSDIAIGTSRLFGFSLMKNFAFPYFSRDMAEFWRRWHISLSTWFRDYLYIPLGGSKGSIWMIVRNTFIVFLVSGFWHGANWTFIAWGALNAVYLLPLVLSQKNRTHLDVVAQGRNIPTLRETFSILLTFFMAVIAWVFFRAENISHALHYLQRIFSLSIFSLPKGSDFLGTSIHPFTMFALITIFIFIEWIGREQPFALSRLGSSWKQPLRYGLYYAIIISIFWFNGKEQEFIYFQF